jgi:hypothetical protein
MFTSKDIKAVQAKRNNKKAVSYYKNTKSVSPALLKGIGILLVLTPFVYFFVRGLIVLNQVSPK